MRSPRAVKTPATEPWARDHRVWELHADERDAAGGRRRHVPAEAPTLGIEQPDRGRAEAASENTAPKPVDVAAMCDPGGVNHHSAAADRRERPDRAQPSRRPGLQAEAVPSRHYS